GVDLVEQMIRSAAGHPLSMAQSDVTLSGWSVESRVYAEDPVRGFLPSIGRLTQYRPPAETSHPNHIVRVDTGVVEGSEISMFYDPMIAKLVTHAPDRLTAIAAMEESLDRFQIDGIQHNMGFLSALMTHPRWKSGELTTNFIAEEFPDGFEPVAPNEEEALVLASVALAIELVERKRLDRLTGRLRPNSGKIKPAWAIFTDGERIDVSGVDGDAVPPVNLSASVGEKQVAIASQWVPGEGLWSGTVNGQTVAVRVARNGNKMTLERRGAQVEAQVLPRAHGDLMELMPEKIAPDTSKYLLCPMPGLVVSLHVEVGDKVQPGQQLAIVEAMKMENILRAEREATVKEIKVEAGQSLAVDTVMVEFD
ncbi:MAG: biotin/lipoyl-containing protein, partial [Devosiaceae bacterium]